MPSRKQTPQGNKVRVECPHCHAAQFESTLAQSTICRKCSEHFDIGKVKAGAAPAAEPDSSGSFFRKLGKLVSGEKRITIQCYACGSRQVVSDMAKSSLCPSCSNYIDLRDHKIATSFSRSIETQGVVTITAKGDVSSTKVVCRDAFIYGKLRGQVICTGEAVIKQKGKILGGIEAENLVVEKRSDVEFSRPLKVGNAEIRGKAYARITAAGVVTITKSGDLEGSVHAKSISVERGGKFSGELYIGKREMEQQEFLPLVDEPGADLFGGATPEPA